MKILIAVPSKGRPDTIFKRTLRWVARTGYDVRVFVEPQEIETYREAARDANYQFRLTITDQHFVDIGKNDGGISYVMSFIKDYATNNGYDLVFKMDDDVVRFVGRGKAQPDDNMLIDFATMVGKCRVTFGKYPDVAAIGFPYRNELYEIKEWVGINMRLQTCYIVRTQDMFSLGVNMMEDFAQYVYIRSKNRVTLRYGLLGIDAADVGKTKGGMQMFDQNKLAQETAEKLRELHPSIKFKKVTGKAWDIEPVLAGDFFGVKKL